MNPSRLHLLLSALIPLLALAACPARGQSTNRTVTHRSSTGSAFSSASGAGFAGGGALAFGGTGIADAEEMMRQVQQAAAQAMQGAALEFAPGFGDAGVNPAAPPPLLVHLRPMDAGVREHWLEDLAVLDRLLQEELARLEGRSAGQALGVRLRLTTRPAPPQWIEDHGVLLQAEVRLPLASADRGAAAPAGAKPSVSAWERARVEVRNAGGTRVVTRTHSSSGGETFDPRRLDELERAVAGVLAEARNLRELGNAESVTVTVAGRDDALSPARATYRATRADIAARAAGDLGEDQFRQRVQKRLQ